MKSQTSLVAQQTRLSEWAEQIRECRNRPQGMTINQWCAQQGITKSNYYWRLRKVRKAFLEATDVSPSFVEIPASFEQEEKVTPSEPKIIAVLRGRNQLTLEITDQVSATFLNAVLGAMTNA